MLSFRRRSYYLAAASAFAGLYAILGLIPISPYLIGGGALPLSRILSPLLGMLFGPVLAGWSVVLGTVLDFGLGRPVRFDFLDFVPDLVTAIAAGLAFAGRRKAAVALPSLLLVWFSLDPAGVTFVGVGGFQVPYAWMHVAAIATLAAGLELERRGRLHRLGPWFVGAVVFGSTMAGHLAGGILTENVVFRLNGSLTYDALQAIWVGVFFSYPLERVFIGVAGTVLAFPVLRAVSRMRRGEPTST